MKRILLIGFFICIASGFGHTEMKGDIVVGPRLQKTNNLYWENGFFIDYTKPELWHHRVHVGLNYVTSRLGTAMHSNALKQDNFILSTSCYFRNMRQMRPIARLNLGYFYADYEAAVFDDLPNTSFLLSLEGGMAYDPPNPLRVDLTLGFNLITGDGTKGPGTLFPLFYQLSIAWQIWGGIE